ncbi:MAG: BMP family ABC transporter substrate-binding protein [Spirochaetaceae bacterium]
MRHFIVVLLFAVMAAPFPVHASGDSEAEAPEVRYVSVMLPDAADSHPLYRMIADGAEAAVADRAGLEVEVLTDVRRGDARLGERAGDRRVELVVMGGGALLEEAIRVAAEHPDTPVLIVDGEAPQLPNAAGILINRREQAFLAGYIAGLRLEAENPPEVRGTEAPSAAEIAAADTAGLLIETELHMGEQVIHPGYRLGLKAAADENRVRAGRLPLGGSASALGSRIEDFDADGIPVLLPALYTNRPSVARTIRETRIDLLWLDEASPETGKGRVLASIPLEIEDLVAEMIAGILDGGPESVETVEASFRTGRMTLNTDFDRFESAFDSPTRRRIERMAERLESGELSLRMPQAPAPPRDPQDQ